MADEKQYAGEIIQEILDSEPPTPGDAAMLEAWISIREVYLRPHPSIETLPPPVTPLLTNPPCAAR